MAYLSSSISISSSPRRFGTILRRIAGYIALSRSRRALARLDAAALNDIGISRRDAEKEAARPFWDAPAAWRD